MPKLWTDTIEEHRRAVHDAALDTAAALVHEHGPGAVTMSRIAVETGIGRATLYKYFPDVEAILTAWHERRITRHLAELTAVPDSAGGPVAQLEAVLSAYAMIQYQHREHDTGLAALLHQGERVAHARQQLHAFVAGLIAAGTAAGGVRNDVSEGELASYCLHALAAASTAGSPAAVHRLVAVILDGCRLVNQTS